MTASSWNRQRGQSLIEFGAAVPILLLLFLGAFDVSSYIVDSVKAQTATRQAARLAAVFGGEACVGTPLTQAQVDAAVAEDVLTVASTMNFSAPTDIYIYRPSSPDGIFKGASDENTHFTTAHGAVQVSTSFPLTDRNQLLPNETSIGVELDWRFNPPTGLGTPALSQKTWAVFKAMAVPAGC